jgi:hypothetical protein
MKVNLIAENVYALVLCDSAINQQTGHWEVMS